MNNDTSIRTYSIMLDLLILGDGGAIDDGTKLQKFLKALKENGVKGEPKLDLTGRVYSLQFESTRKNAINAFRDLNEEGIIDDELFQDFDDAFEMKP